ncbi:MAG: hypothetical protein UU47_C0020G0010 [candidate division TM6 bacterium GW2011_GWE2_41_16]|nr:MAG: hypothetical protein UU47_C0020G0010 [candidate division TM6 bacterium GW2011_GWE2_41_16]
MNKKNNIVLSICLCVCECFGMCGQLCILPKNGLHSIYHKIYTNKSARIALLGVAAVYVSGKALKMYGLYKGPCASNITDFRMSQNNDSMVIWQKPWCVIKDRTTLGTLKRIFCLCD